MRYILFSKRLSFDVDFRIGVKLRKIFWLFEKTEFELISLNTHFIARKTIFSFPRFPEKMIFPKKLRWNMIFFVLSGKMIFPFLENMILHVRRKMKDDLS